MTATPSSIRSSESVAVADERMHRHGIRHLPVMGDEGVVGLVSERDLTIIGDLKGTDPRVMSVAAIMRSPVYTCSPSQSIGEVALQMATRKVGSCVVVDGGALVGLVTTVDLMRYLAKVEREPEPQASQQQGLGELVDFFQREAPLLEAELNELERTLRGTFSRSRQADKQARLQARETCEHMLRYLEQEALLVGRAAARGPSEHDARLLDELHSEHRERSMQLKLVVARIARLETDELAHAMLDLIPVFRSQLVHRAEALGNDVKKERSTPS